MPDNACYVNQAGTDRRRRRAAARRSDELAAFARHRRAAREAIASFLERQAAQLGVELPASADQLAVAVLALSNGIAIEQLADPETVDPSTLGAVLGLLLRSPPAPAG